MKLGGSKESNVTLVDIWRHNALFVGVDESIVRQCVCIVDGGLQYKKNSVVCCGLVSNNRKSYDGSNSLQNESYVWSALFKCFRRQELDFKVSSLQNDPRPEQAHVPSRQPIFRVDELVRSDRCNHRGAISRFYSISHGSVNRILRDRLRYRKVFTQWISRNLTGDSKVAHVHQVKSKRRRSLTRCYPLSC